MFSGGPRGGTRGRHPAPTPHPLIFLEQNRDPRPRDTSFHGEKQLERSTAVLHLPQGVDSPPTCISLTKLVVMTDF